MIPSKLKSELLHFQDIHNIQSDLAFYNRSYFFANPKKLEESISWTEIIANLYVYLFATKHAIHPILCAHAVNAHIPLRLVYFIILFSLRVLLRITILVTLIRIDLHNNHVAGKSLVLS